MLRAVEDSLRQQKAELTPIAYFGTLLQLLGQTTSTATSFDHRAVLAIVYLIDVTLPDVSRVVLRSRLPDIYRSLGPLLTQDDVEAPLLRSTIGCVEQLLRAQDSESWSLVPSQSLPRQAISQLLRLGLDPRPKVRKRAIEAISNVLKNPPPSPSIDHPVAAQCAEMALNSVIVLCEGLTEQARRRGSVTTTSTSTTLIHAMQLVKSIALSTGGWPARTIESLCEHLLQIARIDNEHLVMSVFDVFELILSGMTDGISDTKLPRMIEAIESLHPSPDDSQLVPPWVAVLTRAHEALATTHPEHAFQKIPDVIALLADYMLSHAMNIRVSAAEGLVALFNSCVPIPAIVEPSVDQQSTITKIAENLQKLLQPSFKAAWEQVFSVLAAAFDCLRWQCENDCLPILSRIGELRASDAFNGKKQAEKVIGSAINALGPQVVLGLLPLNLMSPRSGHSGRAWMLPVLREHIANTNLGHFRSEFVPLSEMMYRRVLDEKSGGMSMEIKIYDTIVQQVWSLMPKYCEFALDVRQAFDQSFAEMCANIMYSRADLRPDICHGLQNLIECNKSIAGSDAADVRLVRISPIQAKQNLEYLAAFSSNMLAVLFNIYGQTLPQYRGYILKCIDSWVSIATPIELDTTYQRLVRMLEHTLGEPVAETKKKKKSASEPAPETKNMQPSNSVNLMDLLVIIAAHLPRSAYTTLFHIAATIISQKHEAQLQKKTYKLIPRLAVSEPGRQALQERSTDLQALIVNSAANVSPSVKRDRAMAIATIIDFLPPSDLHFIPSVLQEVVMGTKESNEKARTAAFDLLVKMGKRMEAGGTVMQSSIPGMSSSAHAVTGNLKEYFTMVSGGLASPTPHVISATITALSRLLFDFHKSLAEEEVADIARLMDVFLTSRDREIVRSCLGFAKVVIVSLPDEIVKPRLEGLIEGLLMWSQEHKAQFKLKVRHILERLIRRYGAELIEQKTPPTDRKLISNIRKTRDRNKRQKKEHKGQQNNSDDEDEQAAGTNRRRSESAYDQALEESDDEDSSDDEAGAKPRNRSQREAKTSTRPAKSSGSRKGGQAFIMEDENEPLDLLSSKAFAQVSSTKPLMAKSRKAQRKVQTDADGKLVFREEPKSADGLDSTLNESAGPGRGVNAYMDAVGGQDAVSRGQRGKLKFNTKRQKGEDDDDMELDGKNTSEVASRGRANGARGFRSGPAAQRGQMRGKPLGRRIGAGRRGLEMDRVKGARVGKGSSTRGGGRVVGRRR